MAIYTINIECQKYRDLAKDVFKYLSIILAFCFIAKMNYKSTANIMKCDNFADNLLILIISLMSYHLVFSEVIEIQ